MPGHYVLLLAHAASPRHGRTALRRLERGARNCGDGPAPSCRRCRRPGAGGCAGCGLRHRVEVQTRWRPRPLCSAALPRAPHAIADRWHRRQRRRHRAESPADLTPRGSAADATIDESALARALRSSAAPCAPATSGATLGKDKDDLGGDERVGAGGGARPGPASPRRSWEEGLTRREQLRSRSDLLRAELRAAAEILGKYTEASWNAERGADRGKRRRGGRARRRGRESAGRGRVGARSRR